MNLLFSADQHLKKQTWASIPGVTGDSYHGLLQLAALCISHEAALQLGGDTFNNQNPTPRDIEVFKQAMKLMEDEDLPVYAVQGNHDGTEPPWPTTVSDYVQAVNKKLYYPIGAEIGFYAFDALKKSEVQEAFSTVPKEARIVVCHQLMKQAFGLTGCWNADMDWLPYHVEVALVGDYHEPTDIVYDGETTGHRPPIRMIYPGSTYVCRINEAWQKQAVLIRGDGGGSYTVDTIPVSSRPFHRLVVYSEDDLLEAISFCEKWDPKKAEKGQGLPAGMGYAVIVVQFLTSVPSVASRLRNAIEDRAYLWLEPIEAFEKPLIENDDETEAHVDPAEVSLAGCLSECVEAGSEEYKLSVDLLNASDGRTALQAWRKKAGVAEQEETEACSA